MDIIKQELEELLSSYSFEAEKLKHEADHILDKINNHGLLLFGSGGLGQRTLKGLQKIGINTLGFVDKNPSLWNKTVNGLTVYSPQQAVTQYPEAVYMVTIWSDKIGHPIDEVSLLLGTFGQVTTISFLWLYYKYSEIFLPYFSLDSPGKTIDQSALIYKAFSLFNDELSRKEFVAQLRMRLKQDIKGLGSTVGSKYHFSNELFKLNSNDSIVDIGAFDGDTLKDFINIQGSVFADYTAFEPDPQNFLKLNDYAKSLPIDISKKIIVEQLAVSDEKKQITFDAEGSLQSAYSEAGNIIVNCVSLDDYFFNKHPTYIKIDAEGAEPEIIMGATTIIKQTQPIFAISVYHQYDHLWLLPLAIQEISNDYNFYLRPLCLVSWDLICYAVPKQRVAL